MVDLNGIRVKNRIWLTAGAAGYGLGWPYEKPFVKLGLIDFSAFGAVVTKTITLEPRKGNYIDPFEFEKRPLISHFSKLFSSERKRVLRKVPYGWINNMSWWNVGIDYWVNEIYPKLLNGVTVIPSIGGENSEEYLRLIKKLNHLDVAAIELDISCPNVENNFVLRKDAPYLFGRAKAISKHPLILKIGASEDYLYLAQAAAASRFNAISAINSIPGAMITKDGVFKGGQSGRRIKETALWWIIRLKEILSMGRAAIIGGGGIASWNDCRDFFKVGADAVTLGSGFLSPLCFWRLWQPTIIAKKHTEGGGKWRKQS